MRQKSDRKSNSGFFDIVIYANFLIPILLMAHGQTPFSLADVTFWTGSGSHASVLVIDWNGADNADKSLAWGYRWESAATSQDMLNTVLLADARLYAKLSANQPISVYGLGYDTNGDGDFAISDNTVFDTNGIAVAGTGSADGAVALTPDQYAEGWFSAFWHFGMSDENPFDEGSSWTTAGVGLSDRDLVDGSWDSLAYDAIFSFDDYAENPTPAPLPHICDLNSDVACNTDDFQLLYSQPWCLPPGDPAFDLNHDDVVDSADLDRWLLEAGTAHEFATAYRRGDSNLDRRIDITDFNTLAANFSPIGSAGMIPRWEVGNFDGNKRVDVTDFNFLAKNFSPTGYAASAGAGSGLGPNHGSLFLAVPEPGCWMLSIAALGAGCTLWVASRITKWRCPTSPLEDGQLHSVISHARDSGKKKSCTGRAILTKLATHSPVQASAQRLPERQSQACCPTPPDW